MTPYVTIMTPKLGENVDRMKPALEMNAPVIVIARQPNRFARTLARGPAKQLITNQSAQQETPSCWAEWHLDPASCSIIIHDARVVYGRV